MINAWFLLPALFIGAVGGYIAAALAFTAKRSDENTH